jgi:hypothetical protein
MSAWGDLAGLQTVDGSPLAQAVVSEQVPAVNRRSAPWLDPVNVVGGWASGTRLLVWGCVIADRPPGHWLLCQAIIGDAALTWAHGINLLRQ